MLFVPAFKVSNLYFELISKITLVNLKLWFTSNCQTFNLNVEC